MRAMELDQVRLLVDDWADNVRWYRDVLGLQELFNDGDNYASLRLNDSTALGICPRSLVADAIGTGSLPRPNQGQDKVSIIIEVADPDAEQERLRAAGVPIVAEAVDRPQWGLRTVHVRDPDGNLIELFRPLKEGDGV